MSDHFTSTVDGAAAFERGRALDCYDPGDDRQMTRAEAERDQHGEWLELFFDELHALPVRPGRGRQPRSAA